MGTNDLHWVDSFTLEPVLPPTLVYPSACVMLVLSHLTSQVLIQVPTNTSHTYHRFVSCPSHSLSCLFLQAGPTFPTWLEVVPTQVETMSPFLPVPIRKSIGYVLLLLSFLVLMISFPVALVTMSNASRQGSLFILGVKITSAWLPLLLLEIWESSSVKLALSVASPNKKLNPRKI